MQGRRLGSVGPAYGEPHCSKDDEGNRHDSAGIERRGRVRTAHCGGKHLYASPHGNHRHCTCTPEKLLELEPGLSTAASDFSEDEILRVSTLAGQLTWGAEIGDYERLRAIVETLTTQFELTNENLARLARI